MKIPVVAALLILATGSPLAQVTVYGLVDVSYGRNDAVSFGEKAAFHSGGDDGSSQGNSTTRVGLKGSANLAPELTGSFRLESGGITRNGRVNPGGLVFNRQAWVGASGNFGEIRLGRQDSVPNQAMMDFDFNGAANAASAFAAAGVAAWGTGRQSRSIQYVLPGKSGFKAQLGFVPKSSTTGGKPTFSASLNYAAGNFAAGIAGESRRSSGAAGFSALAASYDFRVIKVMASHSGGYFGSPNDKGYGIGITAPVAGFNIGLNHGLNTGSVRKYATELFVNRKIGDNTYAYIDRLGYDPKTGARGKAYALGVIYTY